MASTSTYPTIRTTVTRSSLDHPPPTFIYHKTNPVPRLHILELHRHPRVRNLLVSAWFERKTHRKLACAMQTLDLIHAGTHAVKRVIKLFVLAHLARGTEDQHAVWSHVVVDLPRAGVGQSHQA